MSNSLCIEKSTYVVDTVRNRRVCIIFFCIYVFPCFRQSDISIKKVLNFAHIFKQYKSSQDKVLIIGGILIDWYIIQTDTPLPRREVYCRGIHVRVEVFCSTILTKVRISGFRVFFFIESENIITLYSFSDNKKTK
jgi:hypothetical protein